MGVAQARVSMCVLQYHELKVALWALIVVATNNQRQVGYRENRTCEVPLFLWRLQRSQLRREKWAGLGALSGKWPWEVARAGLYFREGVFLFPFCPL